MTVTATIAGVSYGIIPGSIQPENRVDDRDTLTISVLDVAGTTLFQKYQPVVLTDSILGTIFTGIINTPTMQQILWPANQKIWQLQCVDQAYRLDKELSNWTYKDQYAGTILAHQLQTYSAADHVSAEFALRWEELLSAWQQGTLSGTTATNNTSTGNVGSGDLELALAGSTVTVLAISNPNQLVPSSYQSILFSAINSGNPLGGSTYDYYEIWSGSYTVASGDTLEFVQWINASSPQCMASIDAQCSDGTWISAFNSSAIVDQQNLLKLAANTDLKSYADNQWYLRSFDLTALAGKTINSFYLVFAGSSQGTYTAYFRDISINNPPGTPGSKLWIYQDGSGLNTSNQAQIIGYNNTNVSIATAYNTNATWLSNGDISAASIYRTSQASIVASIPSGTSLLVETSADNGNTWQAATDKVPLSGFLAGQSVSKLYYRLTMSITGNDPTVQAIVDSVAFTIYPSYSATKSDVSNTVNGSSFSSGTLTNTSVQTIPGTIRGIGHSGFFGTNALMLNGSWRVWQGANINALGGQTLYGTASPAQAVAYNSLQLTTGTGTDVRSRQDYAGSSWQNFTLSIDVQIPASSSDSVGINYRTTNWVNQNNCEGWVVDLAQTNLKLGIGSNSGTTGTYTNVATISSFSLQAGSWHTITVIANGTSHKIFVDGVKLIDLTNNNINVAGYIGVRAFNASGIAKSYYFNNFGVVASLTGTYQSSSLSLSSVGTVGSSMISVQSETLPSGTGYTIQTSLDGGTTWQSATNGGAISGLSSGVLTSGKSLLVRLTLTTANASFTPMIDAYTVYVSSSFSSTGTRSTAPLGYDTYMRANQSGWGTATGGEVWSASGSGTLAIASNVGTITGSGQTHIQSGSQTSADESVSLEFAVGNTATQVGVEARYTNSSGTITAYRAFAQSGNFTLDKRVSGALTTLQVVSFALTIGTNYTIRLLCQGTTIQARIWQSSLSEPTTWQVSQIDSSIASGGVAVSANVATGDTATFTKFMATLYPDPALSLVNANRAANSLVNWNANLPANTTLTVQTSIDNGVTWSTISAPGGAIPGLTLQPDATVDDYSADSHTSYTTTNGTGGSTATWTWDTANKRLKAVGGSKAVAIYNGVSVTDVDMFIDLYQSENAGLIWRWSDVSDYYELIVTDSAASSPNTMKINKVVAGSFTALGSSTGTFTFPTQTHHYVRVTMLGSVITAYFDGISVLTVADASLSSGSCGVRNDTGTSYYYYLYIQPQGQDVSGKSLLTKLTLSTTDPTATPQVTDLQAMVGGPSFWPGVLIPTATYNSATSFVNSNAEDLKNQSDYFWSMADVVDSYGNYDVSFQPREATPAPWPLDENNYQTIAGQQIHDILLAGIGEVYGADLYRNRMVIKNAIATSSYDQIFVGDGKATSWTLSNPIVAAPTSWTLNGLPVSFGLQGVDTGKQFYYQIGSTSITADNSQTVLAVTDSLEIKYSGSSVVDVTRDNLSIPGTITQSALAAITGDSGIVTAVVDVSSQNMSVAAAETYGDQMLARYGVIGVTFNFTTLRSGLREGQQLMLYTPHFNLNKVLTLVTDVRLSQRLAPGVNGGSLWSWQISCSTGPALGSWVKMLSLGLGN